MKTPRNPGIRRTEHAAKVSQGALSRIHERAES